MPENSAHPNLYVGPRVFQTGEKLYGRDHELRDLLDLLIAKRIALLYSPSGAGESSLIQAGLIPQMRDEGFHFLGDAQLQPGERNLNKDEWRQLSSDQPYQVSCEQFPAGE